MRKSSFKLRIPPIAVWLVALAAIAVALLVVEKDFLWKVQEMNLFQSTPLFFNDMMLMPGGLLSYVGTFLTQFLHYPWLGVLILSACWLLLMWLVKRTFQLPGKWVLSTLIPVVLLLLTIVDMGYWVYILKLQGYGLSVVCRGNTACGLSSSPSPQSWGIRCSASTALLPHC